MVGKSFKLSTTHTNSKVNKEYNDAVGLANIALFYYSVQQSTTTTYKDTIMCLSGKKTGSPIFIICLPLHYYRHSLTL